MSYCNNINTAKIVDAALFFISDLSSTLNKS